MLFEGLSGKLQEAMKKLRGKGRVTEKDVKEMMREIKLALLEADVNFKVVKDFIGKVSERAVGQEVLESLTPGQQVIKIVHEELINLMGSANSKVTFSSKPPTREISKTLNIPYSDVVEAFRAALKTYDNSRKNIRIEEQLNNNTGKTAISLLGHPYMIYDGYLSMKLIDKLKARNITVLTPRDIDHETKRKNAYPFEGKVFWDVGFELLGSAFTFASYPDVKGIIYLTPFACGVDAFVLEFIERRLKERYNMPLLKLTIDEHTGEAGFDTRLEAFLDMIG